MKKLIATVILIVLPSILFSENDNSIFNLALPSNIDKSDIIVINFGDENIKVDDADLKMNDFWLAYYNDKENNVYNSVKFNGDEFSYNEKKEVFTNIKNKKFILVKYDVIKYKTYGMMPEYNFKLSSFTFGEKELFHYQFFRVQWFKKPENKTDYLFIPSLSVMKQIQIVVAPDKAKLIKQNSGKVELTVLYRIMKVKNQKFKVPNTIGNNDIQNIKQISLQPVLYKLEYLDEQQQLQQILK